MVNSNSYRSKITTGVEILAKMSVSCKLPHVKEISIDLRITLAISQTSYSRLLEADSPFS